jgi:hypothetical protein
LLKKLPENGSNMSNNIITFAAALPNTQGAIKLHGGGDGFRLQLDVPQTEKAAILRLADLTERLLVVAVKEEGT